MRYFLAADIGGSKTVINVYDENSVLTNSYKTEGFGLAYDSTENIPSLREMLEEIGGCYHISSVAVNLGGKNTEQIKNIFSFAFKNAKIEVFRESDGTAALKLGEEYSSEIILLAGTGTIAIAHDKDGNYIVSGGWGSDIGDDGSGYAIGLKAIRESIKALDSNNPLTPMQKRITGLSSPITVKKNISEIRDIRDSVRENIGERSRKNIASYTRVVEEFAQKGEKDALDILSDAGLDLAKLIKATAYSLFPYKATGLTVTGGLINFSEYWKTSFEKYIKENTTITDINYVKDGVILGTYLIAKENFKKGE